MRIVRLECHGFRALENVVLEPGPGINLIRGKNAQGKTSVLEAFLFASTSKSHRTTQENELVRHGTELFRIATEIERSDRSVRLEANWWRGIKRFKVNGISQLRISDILGKANVVLFSPEDVGLVKGAAGGRRRFLDMELSQLHPPYLAALQQYRQVLRQRNELLRTHKPDPDMLDIWGDQLAQHGAILVEFRTAFVEQLSQEARKAHAAIGEEELSVQYLADVPMNEDLGEALAENKDRDLRRKQTTRGPHRDDLELIVAGKPARNFASQGQQKTAALALKLAEVELVNARVGEYPILMLDEVLAELDNDRARRLFEAIGPEVQCLVTTTEIEGKNEVFGASPEAFLIEEGQLKPV